MLRIDNVRTKQLNPAVAQCKDEFIKAWVGKMPEDIAELFAAIIEKYEKENVFNINMTTTYDSSLLHLIVATGQDQTKAVDVLLANGVNINLAEAGNRTPLHLAIAKFSMNNKNYNFVNFLILKGADVNKGDKEGKTPLHYVVMLSDYSGLNHSRSLFLPLIENGALVAKQDNDGMNAYESLEGKIEEAPKACEIDELKECLSMLSKYFNKEKELATQRATEFEKKFHEKWENNKKPFSGFLLPKIVKRAKNDGIFDVNWDGDGPGITLLHFASAFHEAEVIQLLLDYGADANIQTTKADGNYAKLGYTPLHCVCDPQAYGFKDWNYTVISEDVRLCILLLLKRDAKLSIRDHEGYSVLNAAINNRKHGNGALYDLLMQGQNNPYERSKRAALQTGTYQAPSLAEICLFSAKKALAKTEIENNKDEMSVKITRV